MTCTSKLILVIPFANLNLDVLYFPKLGPIFVSPTLCQFSKYSKLIHFFGKIKLILYQQVRNSKLTLVDTYVPPIHQASTALQSVREKETEEHNYYLVGTLTRLLHINQI